MDEADDAIERLVLCQVCEGRIAQTEGPYGGTDVLTACNQFKFNELAVACTLRGQDYVTCSRYVESLTISTTPPFSIQMDYA